MGNGGADPKDQSGSHVKAQITSIGNAVAGLSAL